MAKSGIPEIVDIEAERETLGAILAEIGTIPDDRWDLAAVLRRHPRRDGTYAKSQLLRAYREMVARRMLEADERIERRLLGRPVRTVSGVAPVAVLTEPYVCPGECLFCPSQSGAPKSYLNGEPGVLRAIQNAYDPYEQTRSRIEALRAIGHPVDKVELLVLGGTWSAYPETYQEWFLRRCFDAMNATSSDTLGQALIANSSAVHRNVGLVIETRPDCITPAEIARLRAQGVTKVQIGAQSLDDRILKLNHRDHSVADTRQAVTLLRLAGFKVVLHWMPNLYGATPASDLEDFARLWDDPALRPDELKIYPAALIAGTGLYQFWRSGEYKPYSEEMLVELLIQCKLLVPPYCRVNRVMRDIPASYIVEGTTKSNLRQVVHWEMARRALTCSCIRCREVREPGTIAPDKLHSEVVEYAGLGTREVLLQYVTSDGRLAGFLRLSLPTASRTCLRIDEILDTAMIRELHVFGPAQELGRRREDAAQHQGLGAQLLEDAARVARNAGYRALSVIAAAGTYEYYRQRGFTEGASYPRRPL